MAPNQDRAGLLEILAAEAALLLFQEEEGTFEGSPPPLVLRDRGVDHVPEAPAGSPDGERLLYLVGDIPEEGAGEVRDQLRRCSPQGWPSFLKP